MTKVYFNNFKLEKNVVTSLNSTINVLSSSISMSQNLDIPNFSATSTLLHLNESLIDIKNRLKYSVDWIQINNKEFNQMFKELDEQLLSIRKPEVKSRQLIVRN